jgi:cell division protein FtsW
VPLPLISAGLSSLLVTMAVLGMLMALARREPGAQQALAARGPGLPRRALSWLGLAGRAPGRPPAGSLAGRPERPPAGPRAAGPARVPDGRRPGSRPGSGR